MTQEQKAKAYDKVTNKLKRFIAQGVDPLITRADVQDFFPGLAESEDERIRKELMEFLVGKRIISNDLEGINIDETLTWLKKQGKKPKKVSIWKHWKDGIAGGSECEQIFLTKIGSVYSISSCLGCECDYIELSELDELMREEKQGKPKWTDDDEQYLLVCKNALRKYQVSDKWDADIISKWLEDKLKQGKQGEKTSKWTEEDDTIRCEIIRRMEALDHYWNRHNDQKLIDWLKSIKQRMEK